jgi:hypothetical protein
LDVKQTYKGACHCGKAQFEVTADIDHVRVCDCSICRIRGALIHRVPEDAVKIITPLSEMSLYEWGSGTAKDYFCPSCGILTLRRPSMPTQKELEKSKAPFAGWAVNTRCLKDFDIFDVREERIIRTDVDVGDILPESREI